jgi:hypothetical protein
MSNRFDRTWALESFSHYHLDSAFFFAKMASELERDFYWDSLARKILMSEQILTKNQRIFARGGQILTENEAILEDSLLKEHRAYVIGSVFAAVAFLEATINEVFLDADRYMESVQRGDTLDDIVKRSLAEAWNTTPIKFGDYPDLDKTLLYIKPGQKQIKQPVFLWPALNRFQFALYLFDKVKPFDTNDEQLKETDVLIRLRNFLTHHKMELVAYYSPAKSYQPESTETASLMNELKVRGFRNRLNKPEQEPPRNLEAAIEARPTTLLGANCAVWVIQQSLKFVSEFCTRMPIEGLKNIVDSRLEELEKPVYTSE